MSVPPFGLQEVRIRYPGSTFTSEFTALNNSAWTAGQGSPATIKANVVNGPIDTSGLVDAKLPNPYNRTRGRGQGAGITGKQEGSFTMSLVLNSSSSDSTILTLLQYVFGGLEQPSQDYIALDNSGVHTTSKLYASGIEGIAANGTALLCGDRGDSKGNGEIVPVVGSGTDYVDLSRTTSGAMADADVVFFSHTVYPDMDATMNYFEVAILGADESSPDQYNCIGCQATEVTIDQIDLEEGTLPIITLTVTPSRWRLEPSGTKATVVHTAASGADPVALGVGGFWICDVYSTAQTRGYLQGGKMGFNPNFRHVPLQDPQHYNNIGGWRCAPGAATWSYVAYGDEGSPAQVVPEFTDDWAADQDHQVMMQFGHAEDACVGIGIDRSFLDRQPFRTELNEMLAYTFEGHAEERVTTTDLLAADFKLHFFHA